MSKVYDKNEHFFVIVNHPRALPIGDRLAVILDAWRGPFEIVLHLGQRVLVVGCYSHEGHHDVHRISDYDEDGNCVIAVPASWCEFYSCGEAQAIEMCIQEDDRLLSYAN